MSILPSIRPITFAENKDNGNTQGRAIFVVQCNGSETALFVRNLVNIESAENTQSDVQKVINDLFEMLSIPSCAMTPDLLKHVLHDDRRNEPDLVDLMNKSNNSFKTIQSAKTLVLETSMESTNTDLMSSFLHSKFGVMVLRHLLDLPWQNMRPMKNEELGRQCIEALNRSYLESPACCLYVNEVHCDVVGEIKPSSLYMRTKPRIQCGVPPLLSDTAVNTPSVETIKSFNALKPDYCYVYGQTMSGYVGNFGNLYTTAEEKAKRKDKIHAAWTTRESFAKQSNDAYSAPKWYDTYAGVDNIADAQYQMVMLDAPPHSVLSTVSAMKRNLIILAYMLLSIRRCSPQSDNLHETLQDMAEGVIGYFMQGKGVMPPTKCPLKVPTTSRCPYLKVEQSVVKRGFQSTRNQSWVGMLRRQGVDEAKTTLLEDLTEGSYQSLPFVNVLSGMNLTEKDRMAITDSNEESESFISLPLSLYSYCSLKNGPETPKVVGGLRTQTSPFQVSNLACVHVIKSTCLYGRKLSLEGDGFQAGLKDVDRIAKQVNMLCKVGLSSEEAYDMLSLTEEQKLAMRQVQDEEQQEPPEKRMRTC